MSQRGADKPGFAQHGLMSQNNNWFHTRGSDGLMSQKGANKSDSAQNGLMSQKGADKSGFAQHGLMSHSGKGFHTSPDTSRLPRPIRETIQPRKTNSLVRPFNTRDLYVANRPVPETIQLKLGDFNKRLDKALTRDAPKGHRTKHSHAGFWVQDFRIMRQHGRQQERSQ